MYPIKIQLYQQFATTWYYEYFLKIAFVGYRSPKQVTSTVNIRRGENKQLLECQQDQHNIDFFPCLQSRHREALLHLLRSYGRSEPLQSKYFQLNINHVIPIRQPNMDYILGDQDDSSQFEGPDKKEKMRPFLPL